MTSEPMDQKLISQLAQFPTSPKTSSPLLSLPLDSHEFHVVAGTLKKDFIRLEEVTGLNRREWRTQAKGDHPYMGKNNPDFRQWLTERGEDAEQLTRIQLQNRHGRWRAQTQHQLVWYKLIEWLVKVRETPGINIIVLHGEDKSGTLVVREIDVSQGRDVSIQEAFEQLHIMEEFLHSISIEKPRRFAFGPLQLSWAIHEISYQFTGSKGKNAGLMGRVVLYNMWARMNRADEFIPTHSSRLKFFHYTSGQEIDFWKMQKGNWERATIAINKSGILDRTFDDLSRLYYSLEGPGSAEFSRIDFVNQIIRAIKEREIKFRLKTTEIHRNLNLEFYNCPTETRIRYIDGDEVFETELMPFIHMNLDEAEMIHPVIVNIWVNHIQRRFTNKPEKWQNTETRGQTITDTLQNEMMHAEVMEIFWRGGLWHLVDPIELGPSGRLVRQAYIDSFEMITCKARSREEVGIGEWYFDPNLSTGHTNDFRDDAGSGIIDQIMSFRKKTRNIPEKDPIFSIFVEDRTPRWRSIYAARTKNAFNKSEALLSGNYRWVMSDEQMASLFAAKKKGISFVHSPWGTSSSYPSSPAEELQNLSNKQLIKCFAKGFRKGTERDNFLRFVHLSQKEKTASFATVFRLMDVKVSEAAKRVTEVSTAVLISENRLEKTLREDIETLPQINNDSFCVLDYEMMCKYILEELERQGLYLAGEEKARVFTEQIIDWSKRLNTDILAIDYAVNKLRESNNTIEEGKRKIESGSFSDSKCLIHFSQ